MDNEDMNRISKDSTIKINPETLKRLLQVKSETGASIKWLVDSAVSKVYPKKEK